MWKPLLLSVVFALGCGNDHKATIDAPGGGGGDGGTDGMTADGPMKALTCAYYCSTIATNCTAGNIQFASDANCMDTCMHFAPGALTDTGGDTLGCRIYHAEMAAADATVHCPHAGPTGGGVCGTNQPNYCAVFCPLETAICPNAWNATGQMRCLGASGCSTIATGTEPYNATATNQTGNTLFCRFWHLTAAATDPTTHCPHTALVSTTCM